MDFWISSLLGLVITLLCFLFWSIISNILMISISPRVSYVVLFGGFLVWWGNKGVIKLFLVYATFVSGNTTLIYRDIYTQSVDGDTTSEGSVC